jgi:hypothetical protein
MASEIIGLERLYYIEFDEKRKKINQNFRTI